MTENEDFFDERAATSDDEGPGLDLRELVLYSIGRARLLILVCAVFGLMGGLAVGFSQPNQYASLAKMFYAPGNKETHRPEDMFSGEGKTTTIQTGIADELKLIENPIVHRRVAERIGARRLLSPPDPTASDGKDNHSLIARIHRAQKWWFNRGSFVQSDRFDPTSEAAIEAAANVARGSLTLYNPPRTNYIDFVSFATNAKLAQDLCQAYIEECHTWHEEFYSTEARVNLAARELEKETARTAARQLEFDEHLSECGNTDVTVQSEQIQGAIIRLKESIAMDQGAIKGLEVEDEQLIKELETTEKTTTLAIPAVKVGNPEYARISGQIETLYQELTDLTSVSQPTSDKYKKDYPRIRTEIAAAEMLLAGTDSFLISELARDEEKPNPRYEQLEHERADRSRERQRRVVELGWKEEQLESAREELASVRVCQPKHVKFTEEIDIARDSMLRLRMSYEAIAKENQREHDEQLQSLRTVQVADFEPMKKAPSRLKMFFGGAFGGLALGVFLAIARQLLDGSVRYPRGVSNKLGVPVVGVVSELPAWRRKTRSL